jgi:hypothetical protein
MARDKLEAFLNQNQDEYSDFLRRFQADPNSISTAEATQRYRELMRVLPAGDAAQVHAQVLGQLGPDERDEVAQQFKAAHNDSSRPFDGYQFSRSDQAAQPHSLAQMTQQAEQQDPDILGQIFGQNSPLNSPLGKLAMSAIVAYLARRVLSNQNQAPGGLPQGGTGGIGAGGQGGLGDLIGVLLGGQGGQSGASGIPTSQQPAGGLGDLIGVLLGGQGGQSGASGIPTSQQPAGGLGGLGGLLDEVLRSQGGAAGGSQPAPRTSNDDDSSDEAPGSGSHRKYV